MKLNLRSDAEQNLKYFWENIRGDMDLQAINTDYGVIPSEQEFDFETSFDFSSIMMIGSTSNAKRCMNDDGTICQVIISTLHQRLLVVTNKFARQHSSSTSL